MSAAHAGERPAPDIPVCVVVCTRNRNEQVLATVHSVLASEHRQLQLIVVDQGTDGCTAAALAAHVHDDRVTHVAEPTVGVARSRNRGLELASSDLVLMTDDDCTVSPDWVTGMIAPLLASPSVALVFGDVHALRRTSATSFVPESSADDFVVHGLRRLRMVDGSNIGIGASMAMRRSTVLALGGFDEAFGPGSELGAAEDTDLTLRVLLAGYDVARTSDGAVSHDGERTPAEFRVYIRRTMFGAGAMCGKLLRCAPASMSWFTARLVWKAIARPALSDVTSGRIPRVAGRTAAMTKGLLTGLRRPIDATTSRFQPL